MGVILGSVEGIPDGLVVGLPVGNADGLVVGSFDGDIVGRDVFSKINVLSAPVTSTFEILRESTTNAILLLT